MGLIGEYQRSGMGNCALLTPWMWSLVAATKLEGKKRWVVGDFSFSQASHLLHLPTGLLLCGIKILPNILFLWVWNTCAVSTNRICFENRKNEYNLRCYSLVHYAFFFIKCCHSISNIIMPFPWHKCPPMATTINHKGSVPSVPKSKFLA